MQVTVQGLKTKCAAQPPDFLDSKRHASISREVDEETDLVATLETPSNSNGYSGDCSRVNKEVVKVAST